jgi:4'-phosphopantetheinyl transferase
MDYRSSFPNQMTTSHWNFTQGIDLQSGEIHVWKLDLKHLLVNDGASLSTLSPTEIARANAFHSAVLRHRYILVHYGLRIILGLYLNFEPEEIIFGNKTHGKPFIASPDANGLNFNLSYSQNLALIAINQGPSIGVDLEFCKVIPDIDQIADRYFSLEEKNQYFHLTTKDRISAFYRGWTRKEALVKAIGSGLSFPLDSFSVSVLPEKPACLIKLNGDTTASIHWQIRDLSLESGYFGALAVEGKITRIVPRRLII